jgi:acetate kinase
MIVSARGKLRGLAGKRSSSFRTGRGRVRNFTASLRDISAALDYLVRYIASEQSGVPEIKSVGEVHAVGHRLVHGGELFSESALIDGKVLQGIERIRDAPALERK